MDEEIKSVSISTLLQRRLEAMRSSDLGTTERRNEEGKGQASKRKVNKNCQHILKKSSAHVERGTTREHMNECE